MLSQTGADKVHLIGHSLGGVVIAQAIASGRLTGKVDTVVTLGSPLGARRGRTCCRSGRSSGSCGKVRHYWPTGLRPDTGRRAMAGIHGHTRHHCARPAVGAAPPPGGDHNGRRRRPQRDAPEPASCRPHSRRVARLRVGRGSRSERTQGRPTCWARRRGAGVSQQQTRSSSCRCRITSPAVGCSVCPSWPPCRRPPESAMCCHAMPSWWTPTLGIGVQWSESSGADDWSKNLIRARCEGRFATSVYSPLGIVVADRLMTPVGWLFLSGTATRWRHQGE